MKTRTLIARSLRFYWRTHLGVVAGAALGALVLTGALFVGDSVQATLRRQAHERTGEIRSAMLATDHFFRAALEDETGSGSAAVLLVRGSVARGDGQARINQAQVLGVTGDFWHLGATQRPALQGSKAVVNRRVAEQLGVREGDTVIVRIEKPSAFSKDAPLSGEADETVALRVEIGQIVGASDFGNFSLQANQIPPFSVFVARDYLQQRLEVKGGANLLLQSDAPANVLRERVAKHWQPADSSLELRPLPNARGTELRTQRVFFDPAIAEAAPFGVKSLTYLVNEIRVGEKSTPYSMATAVDLRAAKLAPEPIGPGEAALNAWEAEDLGAKVGDRLTLKYFAMGERRQLVEKTSQFTVKAILPMETPGLDTTWMPDFPGLSDKKNCRDWEPGFALDTQKIRDQDEAYWNTYRGTPKVFVNLGEGQEIWGNRWGNLTSIRYPAEDTPKTIAGTLQENVAKTLPGMTFVPLREQALAATEKPIGYGFGELFLMFSFFLLIAAAVLTGLLFVFSLEQRNEEAGLLLALGWPARKVRRLLLAEGAALALVGSAIGGLLAGIYTALVLRALGSVWKSAVGNVSFEFSATAETYAIGVASSVFIALLAMWLASRRQLRQAAGALLAGAGAFETSAPKQGRPWSAIVGGVSLVAGLTMLATARKSAPETFFGAGGALLVAGLAFGLAWLRKVARSADDSISLNVLGQRNAARRRGRSLATMAVLASGVFMVVAVDSFRARPEAETSRHSGTGGFALIGESALPIYEDLNSQVGRESLGIVEAKFGGSKVVPMRVREGDDASCLNLNRAIQPRLMGVKPADLDLADLDSRGAFRFTDAKASWPMLEASDPAGIPAVADAETLEWALQKEVGDTVTFEDEHGATFPVHLVASLQGSVLQGSLLIAEDRFVEKFPSSGGYRFFLIDSPTKPGVTAGTVAAELSRALADRGLQVTPAARRLADFQAVANTYLSIFQALGGLGLLLGSAGLAIVVARNVLERRREFGLLEALGFRLPQLRALVLSEHRWLVLGGLGIGTLSALVAVWPSLRDRASGFPWKEMLLLLAALAAGAHFWTWLATRLALRREQLEALRGE